MSHKQQATMQTPCVSNQSGWSFPKLPKVPAEKNSEKVQDMITYTSVKLKKKKKKYVKKINSATKEFIRARLFYDTILSE